MQHTTFIRVIQFVGGSKKNNDDDDNDMLNDE